MTAPERRLVRPQIGPGLPGLPGLPASIGPIRCLSCGQRRAAVHHKPAGAAADWPGGPPGAPTLEPMGDYPLVVLLICEGCGMVHQLEGDSYNVGLAAGVLAELAKRPLADAGQRPIADAPAPDAVLRLGGSAPGLYIDGMRVQ